jgi:eukaryotic-like serine/threonine-protein kinase
MTSFAQRLTAALADRYTVEREVGAGGMATVLLATDVRHGRRVAIKVLRAEIAARAGAERFLREIRTTAALQHPHIVPLFDSGEADGTVFYVMPYVEGETLRDRLDREGQLPVADAVRIAREVADALDYAHRHGVVHRDVKPENILLHEGSALVADFGIALALARSTGDSRLTETGMSVGTPQYMSPEQAMGERHVTARTDIFALGAILYEMLAGEPPFTGESAQTIVAKMISSDPVPVRTIRPTVPEFVSVAIDGALQKVAADRFVSASAFAAALEKSSVTTASRTAATAIPGRARATLVTTGVVALLAASGIGVVIGRRTATPAPPARSAERAVIPLARDQLLSTGTYPLNVSRDGKRLVYVGNDSGKAQLFVRALSDTSAQLLAGTEDASTPVFSPDGDWIAFFAGGKLKKVPRRGGAPLILADAPNAPFGADWGTDGNLLYATGDSALYRVREDGGVPVAIVCEATSAARQHALGGLRWPAVLPGNSQALVTTDSGVGVMDLKTGAVRVVLRGRQARYLPTRQLLFDDNEGHLRVVAFDVGHGEVRGASVPVFEAFRGPGGGASYFTVSENGTLVYEPGSFQRTLVRVDRYGRETPINVESRGYRFPSVSPDGRLIAVTVDPRPSQIWLVDPAMGRAVPLTSDGAHSYKSIWSPDGKRVAYTRASQQGESWIAAVLAQPNAPVEILFRPIAAERRYLRIVNSWPTADDIIGFERSAGAGLRGTNVVHFRPGDSSTSSIVASVADDRQPALSPNGKWLAYMSDISGANEVYVRPYGLGGASQLASSHGGVEPRWSPSGTELIYRSGSRIMSVSVRTKPDFRVLGAPQVLFSGPFDFSQDDNWSPSPDGSFIMVKADPNTGRQLRVVFNWFEELKSIGSK